MPGLGGTSAYCCETHPESASSAKNAIIPLHICSPPPKVSPKGPAIDFRREAEIIQPALFTITPGGVGMLEKNAQFGAPKGLMNRSHLSDCQSCSRPRPLALGRSTLAPPDRSVHTRCSAIEGPRHLHSQIQCTCGNMAAPTRIRAKTMLAAREYKGLRRKPESDAPPSSQPT